ncbi:HTH-type transcriptional activator RhaS [Paraburkholderia domus]|nr:HTH-type transcriptional activator RhaS [Paraburkholderia domus]
MQTQIDLRGQRGIMDQRALIDSPEAAVNVAIVLCDGFSLLDVSLVAEVFRQKNELSDAAHTLDKRDSVTMLSSRGGYVTDSESVRIRTDAIDEHLSEHFDGVFVFGGKPKNVASIDQADLRALRKVLLNASLVRWSDHGWGMIAASGYEPKSEGWRSGSQQSEKKHSYVQNDRSVAGRGTNGLLAAALSFVPADLCIEIAHRISRHVVAPSLDFSCFDEDALSEVSVADRIHASVQWLRKNCRRSISVAQAAEAAGMSERTFLRHFKHVTGKTPSEFLLDARFEMICRLLRETTLPVDKIARRCGMGGGEHVSRVFRRRLSQTPTEYRATHRATDSSA